MKKIRYIAVLAIIFFISFAPIIFAQSSGGTPNPPVTNGGTPNPPCDTSSNSVVICNPLRSGDGTLFGFLNSILRNVVLPIGGLVAAMYIIYAGFLFVTARGNESKLEDAKKAFLYAVIGTAILLGAVVISAAVKDTVCQIVKC